MNIHMSIWRRLKHLPGESFAGAMCRAMVMGGGTQYIVIDQLLGFFLEHTGQKPETSSLIPPSTSSARAIQSPGSAQCLPVYPFFSILQPPSFPWIFIATLTQVSLSLISPPSKWASKNRKLIVGATPLHHLPH